jgi:hypothetical protein
MKIVVIQRHEGNIDGIRKCVSNIDKARAEEIVYTTDPNEVVETLKNGEPALVVSGQVFESSWSGTDLARVVKRMNPRSLFFIYSVMPERNEAVDGVIPKNCGTVVSGEHSLLARILTSAIEGTPESMRVAFLGG